MEIRARVNDEYRRDAGHGMKEVRRVKSGQPIRCVRKIRKTERDGRSGQGEKERRRFAPLSDSGRNEKWLALIFQAHCKGRSSRSVPLFRNHPPHRLLPFGGPWSRLRSGATLHHPLSFQPTPFTGFSLLFLSPARRDTHIPI